MPLFNIFVSSMNEKQNWIVRNKREFQRRPRQRKGITPPQESMQPSKGSKPPAYLRISVLLSNATKALCKPWQTFLKSRGGSPEAAWREQSVLCHSLPQQEMELTSRAGQSSPTSNCPQELGRIKPQEKQEMPAHTAQSSRGWRDVAARLPVPGISPILYLRLLLTVFSITSKSPVSHTCIFITSQLWLHSQAHNYGKQKRWSLTSLSTQKV